MKKKFKFKLEGLLKLRIFRKRRLEVEVGKILQEIGKVNREIDDMNVNIKQIYDLREKLVEDNNGANILHMSDEFITSYREEITNRNNYLDALRKKHKEKIKEMNIAVGELKVISSLKEQKLMEHNKKVIKHEAEELEEIINMREQNEIN